MVRNRFTYQPPKSSAESLMRAQVNSRRVRMLKTIFPVTALVIAVTLFAWPVLKEELTADLPDLPKMEKTHLKANKLVAPKINSRDRHGRAFKLEADSASKADQDAPITHLDRPKSSLSSDQDGPLTIQAKKGDYNQEEQVLHYNEEVTLETGSGFKLQTNQADLDVHTQKAVGHNPVTGQGPAGHVDAQDGFEADKETIHFKGKTKLVIKQGGHE